MAEVISFPRQKPGVDSAPSAWPGQLIDLEAARTMAGVSVDDLSDCAPGGDEEIGAAVETPAAGSSPRQIAVRTLAARGRSVAELRAKLADRGIEAEVIDQELARLQSEGLLGDYELAEGLVWSLTEHKKLGPVAIRQALLKRKIPGAIIDQVVPSPADTDPDVIDQLAKERLRVLGGLEPEVQKRRLIGFLARRGYSGSAVYQAVDKAVGAS